MTWFALFRAMLVCAWRGHEWKHAGVEPRPTARTSRRVVWLRRCARCDKLERVEVV